MVSAAAARRRVPSASPSVVNTPAAGVFNNAQFAQLLANADPMWNAPNGLPSVAPTVTPNPPSGSRKAVLSTPQTWTSSGPRVASDSATMSESTGSTGQFQALVSVTNVGNVKTNHWKVTWTWSTGETVKITNGNNAPSSNTTAFPYSVSLNGSLASVTAQDWMYSATGSQNGAIAVGATTQFEFTGTYSPTTATNTVPALTCTAS